MAFKIEKNPAGWLITNTIINKSCIVTIATQQEKRDTFKSLHEINLDEKEINAIYDTLFLRERQHIKHNPNEITLRDFSYFKKLRKNRDFIVEKMLMPRTVNMLFSPPAQFKSLLALNLALCVANGKDFLGMKVKKAPVLLLDKENNEDLLRERILGMHAGMNLRRTKFPLWLVVRQGDLDNVDFVDNLTATILEKKIKLVIFDTLHRFANYEENRADDINKLYTRIFQPIIDNCDCSVLFLHHTTKQGDYRGSSDLMGSVDTAYSVVRHHKGNSFELLCEKARFGEISDIHGEFDFNNDEGYIKLLASDEHATETQKREVFNETTNEIKALFVEYNTPLTRAEIFTKLKEIGCNSSERTQRRALSWLVKMEYLSNDEKGKYVSLIKKQTSLAEHLQQNDEL